MEFPNENAKKMFLSNLNEIETKAQATIDTMTELSKIVQNITRKSYEMKERVSSINRSIAVIESSKNQLVKLETNSDNTIDKTDLKTIYRLQDSVARTRSYAQSYTEEIARINKEMVDLSVVSSLEQKISYLMEQINTNQEVPADNDKQEQTQDNNTDVIIDIIDDIKYRDLNSLLFLAEKNNYSLIKIFSNEEAREKNIKSLRQYVDDLILRTANKINSDDYNKLVRLMSQLFGQDILVDINDATNKKTAIDFAAAVFELSNDAGNTDKVANVMRLMEKMQEEDSGRNHVDCIDDEENTRLIEESNNRLLSIAYTLTTLDLAIQSGCLSIVKYIRENYPNCQYNPISLEIAKVLKHDSLVAYLQ